jgi:murein DD-endopeptidase MepM/ murein hydrolase activator NlpD
VQHFTLTRRLQATVAATGVASIALLAYAAGHAHVVDRAVALWHGEQFDRSAAELQAEIDQLKRQLATAGQASVVPPATNGMAATDARIHELEQARDQAVAEREELRRQLGAAQDSASSKSQNLAQINKTLDANRGQLRQSDMERAALQDRLRSLQGELDTATTRAGQYKTRLDAIERKLTQLSAEHDKTVAERDRLRSRVSQLQSGDANAAAAPGTADATPDASAPAQQQAMLEPPPASDDARSSEIERIIASTGIDVEKLLARFATVPQGQGGPYIALDKTKRAAIPDAERSEELQRLVKSLPLTAPLEQFRLESPFGARPDPFEKRQAFHAGLDLVAPYRTPVYSTAPGVVIFNGVREGYGKVVEVDHGHGFVTRYAHLHRIVVAHGQKIPVHQQVGELGSTGRSTGPHLHYEVLVNGVPQDPEKFMQAGKDVVQASNRR